MNRNSERVQVGPAALIVAIGAALDLATKAWARASLEPYGPAFDFLPFVSLHLTFNEGVSFGLFAFEGDTGQAALVVVTGLLTLAMTGMGLSVARLAPGGPFTGRSGRSSKPDRPKRTRLCHRLPEPAFWGLAFLRVQSGRYMDQLRRCLSAGSTNHPAEEQNHIDSINIGRSSNKRQGY